MTETVFSEFSAVAQRAPEVDFLVIPAMPERVYHPAGIRFSYGEVLDRTLRLQQVYRSAGYGAGHRVALLLENRPEFYFHFLALNSLGVSIVPINPDAQIEDLGYVLRSSDADLAISIVSKLTLLSAAAGKRERSLDIIAAEVAETSIPSHARPARESVPGADHEAALIYTSGTTGLPKACVLSNQYFRAYGASYQRIGLEGGAFRGGPERIYLPLPLFHCGALAMTTMGALLTGSTLILVDRFHPRRYWQDLTETGATVTNLIGIMSPILLKQEPGPFDRAHTVKLAFSCAIDPALHDAFEQRFGFPLYESWGMTETGRIWGITAEPRLTYTRAVTRLPLPDVEARVIDEAGEEVAIGTEGELVLRARGSDPRQGFFTEYLNDPEATVQAWRGGWFHTGDIMKLDGDGVLYFVERRKNMIRRSGENISAAEVETVLVEHPAVLQVAVLPVRDEQREEEVLACVVLRPEVGPSEEVAIHIFEHVRERLAYFKAPGWLLFMDTLPTTATHKVVKAKIFKPGEDPRSRSGNFDFRSRKIRPVHINSSASELSHGGTSLS